MKNSCTILCACVCVHVFVCRQGGSERGRGRRERAREGDKEGGRKGGKGEEVGREGDKEGGREKDKEGGRERDKEGGRGREGQGGKKGNTHYNYNIYYTNNCNLPLQEAFNDKELLMRGLLTYLITNSFHINMGLSQHHSESLHLSHSSC